MPVFTLASSVPEPKQPAERGIKM